MHRAAHAGGSKARLKGWQIQRPDIGVGHNGAGRARRQSRYALPRLRQETLADKDAVGPPCQRNLNGHWRQNRRRRLWRKTQLALQGQQQVMQHRLMRPVTRLDRYVRQRIDRIALVHQAAHRRLRVRRVEQRPVAALAHPPHHNIKLGLQPDRQAGRGNLRARCRLHECPPACGDDFWPVGQQPRHHALFAIAEMRLAMFFENFRNGHSGRGLDLGVGVGKHQPEVRCEAAAHGGLACAHDADEHDGASAQGRDKLRGLAFRKGRIYVHDCPLALILAQIKRLEASMPRGRWSQVCQVLFVS